MKFQTETEMNAYFAGFFDGEGCIGIYCTSKAGPSFNLRISIGQKHREILDFAQSIWGGAVYKRIDKRNQRSHYIWEVTAKKAEVFLDAVSPYCVEKKRQIKAAKSFRLLLVNNRVPKVKPAGLTDRILEIKSEIQSYNAPMGLGISRLTRERG